MQCRMLSLAPTTEYPRDSVGGRAIVRQGVAWPVCPLCAEPMVFYIQFDVPVELGLKPGSHVTVFACLQHSDPLLPHERDLPSEQREYCQFAALLHHAGEPEVSLEPEVRMLCHALRAELSPDDETQGRQGLKLGGAPSWAQGAEQPTCSCGSAMVFLAQIPADFEWPKAPGAVAQECTYGDTEYLLFLGNETYLFGCPVQCRGDAVTPVCQ